MSQMYRKRIYSADGKQEWTEIWGWVDAAPSMEPLKEGPLLPGARKHDPGCWCADCWSAGMEYAEYLKNKQLFNDNGF